MSGDFIKALICMTMHRKHHMGAVGGGHVHQWCDKCQRYWTIYL